MVNLKPWNLMFGGAFACAILCLLMVYYITVTGNISYEVVIYILVFFGFGFAAGGYLIESKYKKEHPEEFEVDYPGEE